MERWLAWNEHEWVIRSVALHLSYCRHHVWMLGNLLSSLEMAPEEAPRASRELQQAKDVGDEVSRRPLAVERKPHYQCVQTMSSFFFFKYREGLTV